ncbi:uncharacterized protein LOC21390260 isoform X2 [Morus notabilis]|uniref:uncharacterized protein LOC21390260 isoform X2 n=1 Tax=Morus notabilis TaxID=981085 RepID=UPI000CECF23B|nr:uncharacterized protein LOC21390260 isoform X2 [Morus notabilis]
MAASERAEVREMESEKEIALNFPAEDGGGIETASSPSSPVKLPWRLRRRLLVSKAPITAEDIESKLSQARLRRQQFYELWSSKARAKAKGPSWHPSQEEDLGKRLEAKLSAAEQKRLSILEKAQTRLARLDELRQAAKAGVETRFEKEKDELGAKVQLRAKQAEENRMRLLKACSQWRAARRDRAIQSLMQRRIKERKYKDCIHAAICQKRVAAERKRSKLLEEEKARACARIQQVRRAVKSAHSQQEIERIKMKDKLEDRLLRANKQRKEYLKLQRSSHHSVQTISKMVQEQEALSKIARCWRWFVHLRKTTFALAKAFEALAISEESAKSMSFEQLALQIASATTIQTTKALVARLEIRKGNSNTSTKKKVSGDNHSGKEAPRRPVVLSRYPARVFLSAYMILGQPDAVFNRRAECENTLPQSAANFVQEFELLLRIIIHGPIHSSQQESAPSSPSKITLRSQLEAFDKAWCSYLLRFVEWKDSDARLLEDLKRAASQLELSMMQANRITLEEDVNGPTRAMKAFQRQVTENQKLLKDKLQHLSGNPGLEGMETALSATHSRYIESKDSACLPASPAALNSSSSPVSGSAGTRELSNTYQSSSQKIRASFDKDETDHGEEVGSFLSFKTDASGHPNPAALVVGENELLVNDIVHEHHHGFADRLNGKDESHNSLEEKVRETMDKAFWDGVMDSMKENDSDFSWILKLVTEVRDELRDISQSWKQEISESIDIDILSQVLRSGHLDMDYFGKILEFALATLRKLAAPANEDDLKTTHYKFLKELGEILQAEESKTSRALAITKGLHFVLQQIQGLKREINKARLRMVEPLIKSTAGLEYLKKAFSYRHGSPSHAFTSLPITRRWLSSVKTVAEEEWHEYVDSLSSVTSDEHSSGLPPTTLRTGGRILVGTKISSQTSSTTDTIDASSPGKKLPECRGERIDLLVRLGLLKLVSEVGGLNLEVLPETLELNLPRLRAVQSQLQKIIVISTCVLVLRQILLSENLITNPLEMEKIASRCSKQLSNLLDTVEDVGLPEIIETIFGVREDDDHLPYLEKLHARKQMMSNMVGKSLQSDDVIFKRVSRAVYLAARGVVLDGNGVKGKELAEASLRRIGAALLADDLIKAVEVLVVAAVVSCNVHRPWYEELIKNI